MITHEVCNRNAAEPTLSSVKLDAVIVLPLENTDIAPPPLTSTSAQFTD